MNSVSRVYPWESWLGGGVHLLIRGRDFDVCSKAFVAAADRYARTHGRAVSLARDLDCVWLRFSDALLRRTA